MIRVWDPLVRVFHWSLVAVFALAWLTAEGDETWHEWAGYAAAGLIGIRLVWGLVGPRYARFAQFVRSPKATLCYLRAMIGGREPRYIGHNPAGAAMIVALLVTMSATAFTGWLMAEPARIAMLPELPQIVAPAFADSDDYGEGRARREGGGAVKEAHEVLANLMLALVLVHVAGIGFASWRTRENLPRAMVTGQKRAAGPGDIT